MPLLITRIGLVRAIISMQLTAAALLPFLIWTAQIHWAAIIFLLYFSAQTMCEPALENFLMELALPAERNRIASLRYMIHFLISALAVAVTGSAIIHIGYSFLLGSIAVTGVSAALLFYIANRRQQLEAGKDIFYVRSQSASEQNIRVQHIPG
jgi:predicted MFS family arabinose efflux permease